MILKRLVLLSCLLVVTRSANAQVPSAVITRDPQALAAVQAAITAMGGAANLSQIRTAVVQGTSEPTSGGDTDSASFIWTWASGEFRMENQSAAGSHTTFSGHGHPVDVRDGTSMAMGQQLLRSELPFHIPALALATVLNNPDYSLAVIATTTVDGKSTLHVHASDDSDAIGQQVTPQEWYFDESSGLPVRVEYRFPFDGNPKHWILTAIDFANYQAANGTLVPFQLGFTVNGYSSLATVGSVIFNVGVAATEFDPASGSAQ